jgi:hypothetical protein
MSETREARVWAAKFLSFVSFLTIREQDDKAGKVAAQ